jgi:hypothetical protein
LLSSHRGSKVAVLWERRNQTLMISARAIDACRSWKLYPKENVAPPGVQLLRKRVSLRLSLLFFVKVRFWLLTLTGDFTQNRITGSR